MSGALNLHPDIQRLRDENALLREELTNLFTEADQLIHVVKPNLLALYQTRIGAWELKVLTAQCQAARLKRVLELVQADLNRGRQPDLTAVEGQIELEFLQWQTKLKEAAGKLKEAEEHLKHPMSPEDDREFKKLYYALVKRLHPDINPKLTADQKRLWHRVQAAYQACDLPELRALALLAEKEGPVSAAAGSQEKLRRDQATLKKQIAETLKRIEAIRKRPPFALEKQLADDPWVAARRRELEERTADFERQTAMLKEQLRGLLGRKDDGHVRLFGPN